MAAVADAVVVVEDALGNPFEDLSGEVALLWGHCGGLLSFSRLLGDVLVPCVSDFAVDCVACAMSCLYGEDTFVEISAAWRL